MCVVLIIASFNMIAWHVAKFVLVLIIVTVLLISKFLDLVLANFPIFHIMKPHFGIVM